MKLSNSAKHENRKTRKMLLAIIVIIIVILAVAGLFLQGEKTAYSENVPLDIKSRNTNLAGALFAGGIKDPFIDVTFSRTYVAYMLPDGYNPGTAQRFVIGASAQAAPDSQEIIAVQYTADTPSIMWTLETKDFESFMHGEITADQMEARIEKKSL